MNYAILNNGIITGVRSRPGDGSDEDEFVPVPANAECADLWDGTTLIKDNAARITVIKAAAGVEIYGQLPAWKQNNMLMEGLKLERKDRKGGLTVDETSTIKALEVWGGWIEAVRAESDRLEADTLLTVADANWPTKPASKP